MATSTVLPADAFSLLSTALDWQPGFGLCFVFSDSDLGSVWLRNRLEEHLCHDEPAKTGNFFRFVGAARDAGDFALALSACFGDMRNVVWGLLPREADDGHAYVRRLNEQRQRLIASGNFFIIEAPSSFAHELPAWAPDLWSVRTLIFQVKSTTGKPVQASFEISWRNATKPPAAAPATTRLLSPALDAWQRTYANWKAKPEGSRPAVDLALRASQDAQKLRLFDLSLACAEQALEVADYDLGRADALHALGVLQSRLGRLDAARDLYTHAIVLYKKEQDDLGRANALHGLGNLQSRLGQLDAARDLYTQAIVLHEKEQNDLGRANVMHALGILKSRLGQLDAARHLYTQAIALFEKEQDDLGRANALLALGDLQNRWGQINAACDLYTQAIALFEKEQNDLGRANTLKAMGDLQSRLGQIDAAHDLYTQALALFEKEQDNLGLAYAWTELACGWQTSPESTQQARNAAKAAVRYARKTNSPPVLQQVQQKLQAAGLTTD